jgi:hypothetical protein
MFEARYWLEFRIWGVEQWCLYQSPPVRITSSDQVPHD